MTTIVYDHKNKQIAIDGRMTTGHGEIISEETEKTLVVDGCRWLFSGDFSELEEFSKLKHRDEFKSPFVVAAFVIKDNSVFRVVTTDNFISFCKIKHNADLGSGGSFAIAALDFGKTAREAVEYAITKDCYSGGKVRVFNLDGEEVK